VGIETSGGGVSDDVTPIRRALKAKFGKYGVLDRPYVVALNALGSFVNDVDVQGALFGNLALDTEKLQLVHDDGGLWQPTSYTRVSGVLAVQRLRWDNIPRVGPVLWVNPWAEKPLRHESLPFTKRLLQPNGKVVEEVGTSPAELFDLPSTWPEV
jgi:hypothetical protein